MQSHDERNLFSIKTIWLLLAISLNALELFLPRIPFLPWLKPGLANCITVVWIIRFGVKDAILFTLLRSWISGFYFGFSLLTLSLSLSGGIVATAAMGMAWNVLGKRGLLGTIGLSITGAFFHNSAQLLVVYFLLTHNASVFYQLPFMGAASIVFGTFAGLIVPPVWNILNRMELPEVTRNFSTGRNSLTVKNAIICQSGTSVLFFSFCYKQYSCHFNYCSDLYHYDYPNPSFMENDNLSIKILASFSIHTLYVSVFFLWETASSSLFSDL